MPQPQIPVLPQTCEPLGRVSQDPPGYKCGYHAPLTPSPSQVARAQHSSGDYLREREKLLSIELLPWAGYHAECFTYITSMSLAMTPLHG